MGMVAQRAAGKARESQAPCILLPWRSAP